MSSQIIWKTKEVEAKDLKSYSKNPRQITDKNKDLLKESLENYGQAIPLVVNADLTVLGGNQRLSLMKGKVQVKYPDRLLTEKEQAELVVILNNKIGEWDFSKLEIMGLTKDVLIDYYGFDEEFIEKHEFKIDDLGDLLGGDVLNDGFTANGDIGNSAIRQLIIKFNDVDKTAIEIETIIKSEMKAESVQSMEDLILTKARKYETNNS